MPNQTLENRKNCSNNNVIKLERLDIDSSLFEFVNDSVLKQIGLQKNEFWSGVQSLLEKYVPVNNQLLAQRVALQNQINEYHKEHSQQEHYCEFLSKIGYLKAAPEPFEITSSNVDDEIALLAGPQLVVPVMNARYALNAVNARWGSLYDALYGTDVITNEGESSRVSAKLENNGYNAKRGAKVIQYGREFLNKHLPLSGSWNDISSLKVVEGKLSLVATENNQTSDKSDDQPNDVNNLNKLHSLNNRTPIALLNPQQFVGYQGQAECPSGLIFKHHQLHIIIKIDANDPIGQSDPAHIKDIVLESALTTIMDCEDSVAAVDAEDKVIVYKNWLGLMQGDLSESITKNGKTSLRSMNQDIPFTDTQGNTSQLSGRAVMFVRNVGHLMTNPAIQFEGQDIPEGIMDGIFTAAIGKIDVLKTALSPNQADNKSVKNTVINSKKGSIYIVKPKMHGPEEVSYCNDLFDSIEDLIKLPRHTLKVGIMDEERRTSVNLRACIKAAKNRVVFINTGFLDRTGDELHTSMLAGPFKPKADLKAMTWLSSYETSNVNSGLLSGFHNHAQIGKGMWPIPDQMANMMKAKIAHPQSGANTAWVPSPTAATLHAMHYHDVDVAETQRQQLLELTNWSETEQQLRSEILQIPLLDKNEPLTPGQINHELDNNAQGILGYVVKWVNNGIGCSKVADINNVGLMEDRATCRISSQHMANWLVHGICSKERIIVVMKKMAAVVDQQNKDETDYEPMGPDFDRSIAFNAALNLVLKGNEQPNGYTEPLLHEARLAKKAS